jgi:GT2 family glycosyltransferase
VKELDVIFLSNTSDIETYKMTQNAISSLKNSESNEFNIILVESNKNSTYKYEVDHYIVPEVPFNYNTYLNIGAEYCECDFTAVSNNDVVFNKGWWTKMKAAFESHNLDTASPKSPTEQFGLNPYWEIKHRYTPITKIVEGFDVVYTFCGWCWVMKKSVREWIFPLDEQFSFFFQDNDITKRLQQKGCKHALVGGSLVNHLGQRSHKILHQSGEYMKHTFDLEKNFKKKWG